jgi:hypothetical protein
VIAELPGSNRFVGGSREVVILPDGTYRLVGRVVEAEYPDAPVADARVEVTPGSLVTTTGFDGTYQLYGVPADAEVRVTAAGYRPHVERLNLTGHATKEFRLALSGARLNLNGQYTLTIDILGSCPGSMPLPADLQHRSYEAVVTQTGPDVVVTLTEPRFRVDGESGNRFRGRADAVSATFTLESFYLYYGYFYGVYPDIVERLSNGTYLVPFGTAVTTGSATRLSGDLSGGIENWDTRFPATSSRVIGSCYGRLRFTLTRR